MVHIQNQTFAYQDSAKPDPNAKQLRIIHFNDVYNIEGFDSEPSGGASRFKTALDFFQNKKNLVLFSGDAFSPSTCIYFNYLNNFSYLFFVQVSLFSKGAQMVECLNKFNINAAVVGNHEFGKKIDKVLNNCF